MRMDDTKRVERTVFLDKCMVNRIVAWFLITLFDEKNKDWESTLRSVVKNYKPADFPLYIVTSDVVDHLYEMYQEAERQEDGKYE